MSNIILDLKKIDFSTAALTIFCPNGKAISINKTKGFDLHIKYLDTIRKNDKEIKNLLANVDMKYFYENPPELMDKILPIFAQNNYSIFINLNPNITETTNYGLFFLPEDIPKCTKTILSNMKEKNSNIIFLNNGKYNQKENIFELYLTDDYQQEPNYDKLIQIINHHTLTNNDKTK